jgi:hypothetical protein
LEREMILRPGSAVDWKRGIATSLLILCAAAALFVAAATTAVAQDATTSAIEQTPAPPPPEPPRPDATTVPRTPRPPRAAATTPPEPPVRVESTKSVNIRVDATIIESRGDQTIGRRVISATMVDGENASVRSMAFVPMRQTDEDAGKAPNVVVPVQQTRALLNMDAKARLRADSKVQVWLTVESQSAGIDLGEAGKASDATIRQSVSVLLDPGTPIVVAQSADAVGNRRLTLEVKATVLK